MINLTWNQRDGFVFYSKILSVLVSNDSCQFLKMCFILKESILCEYKGQHSSCIFVKWNTAHWNVRCRRYFYTLVKQEQVVSRNFSLHLSTINMFFDLFIRFTDENSWLTLKVVILFHIFPLASNMQQSVVQ